MNQILSMNQENPAFGNNSGNFNGNMNGNNGGKLELKTVKIIFAILVIIFGLVMTISGIIGVVNYYSTPKGPIINYPVISTLQNANILTLSVQNDVVIDVIEYSWNNGRIQEILGNNSTEIIRDITIPEGNNVLNLTIIDVNGKITQKSNSFVGVEEQDTTPPKIELVVVSSKLNISAKTASETKLSYLTYKWNDGEETRIEATGDRTSIETSIDILSGTNTLTVVAVNENGITDTQVKQFNGIKKPVIEVKKDATGQYLEIKITHETGVKSAEIILNDNPIVLTPDNFGKPVVEIKIRLKEDNNTIKIVATSLDGNATETFTGTATKD